MWALPGGETQDNVKLIEIMKGHYRTSSHVRRLVLLDKQSVSEWRVCFCFFVSHGLVVKNKLDDFSDRSHDFGPLPFLMNSFILKAAQLFMTSVSGGSGLSDSCISPHALEIFLLFAAVTISNYRDKSSRASTGLLCVSSWSTCSPGQCFQNNLTWVGGLA